MKPLLAILLSTLLVMSCAIADGLKQTLNKTIKTKPIIAVNIGFEVEGLESAIKQLAESLDNIAKNPNLTEAQNKRFNQTIATVEKLNASIAQAVKGLPATIENSIKPIAKTGKELSNKFFTTVIITAIALILIVIAVGYSTYRYVIKPSKQTLNDISTQLLELSKTLETTAKIVEKSSNQNLKVIKQMNKLAKK